MNDLKKFCNTSGLSLSRLYAFLEVCRAGGITKATSDVRKQSLYSRQLKDLRKFFGFALFDNHGKTLVLTEAGRKLVPVAQEALQGLYHFNEMLNQRPLRFTIAGGGALLSERLAPRLGNFEGLGKSVTLSLRSMRNKEVIAGLHDRSIDFGILKEKCAPARLEHRHLGQINYALYVPEKLLGKRAPNWDWMAENLPIACQASEGKVLLENLENGGRKGKRPLHFAIETDTYMAVLRLLASETIAAVLPTFVSERLDQRKYRRITTPELKDFGWPAWLLWSERMVSLRGDRAIAMRDKLISLLTLPA